MGLFASLAPYLILYLAAISPCPVCLLHSCSAHLSRFPFMSLGGVCLCLEDQTGASCFTSSVSSRSQIGTNCFNNKTRRGLASQTDSSETRGQQAIPSQLNSAGAIFAEEEGGRCYVRFNRGTSELEVTTGENRGNKEEERTNYVL